MPAPKPVRPTAAQPKRSRVLLVDDEPAMLETTAALLAPHHEVSIASDARAALAFLKRIHFDVVCSDFGMPEMDGIELLRLVAASDDATACILLTGHGDYAKTFAQDREADRFYVVIKPFEPDQLLEVIARAAQRSTSRRRLVAASADAKRSAAEVMTGALSKRFKE